MDFNEYVQTYQEEMQRSLSFAGTEHKFYMRAKAVALQQLAGSQFGDLHCRSALDVGCGIGLMEPHLTGVFGELVGIDSAEQAVAYARSTIRGAEFLAYDGQTLPFPDNRFDVVFATCVLHHVPPQLRPALLAEMARVTAPGGLTVLFEHNPNNPLTRWVVARCEFDRDAILLRATAALGLLRAAGLEDLRRRYLLFFPWAGRLWSTVEKLLAWLPLGAQYYAAAAKPQLTRPAKGTVGAPHDSRRCNTLVS